MSAPACLVRSIDGEEEVFFSPVSAEDLTHDRFSPPAVLLERILAEGPAHLSSRVAPRAPKGMWSKRRLAFVAGCLAAAAMGVSIMHIGGATTASAAATIDKLAAAASRQEALVTDGGYLYSSTKDAVEVTADAGFTVRAPETTESWVRGDGSGRQVVRTGTPEFFGARDRARWVAAGSPVLVSEGSVSHSFAAGEFPSSDTKGLSADIDSLKTALSARVAEQNLPPAAGMVEVVGELLSDPAIGPQLKESLYRVLAQTDGLTLLGAVEDPLGRLGVGVSITSGHTGAQVEQRLIFDPATGMLLASVDVLVQRVPWLDVDPPTVLGYHAVLKAGVVTSPNTRPSTG